MSDCMQNFRTGIIRFKSGDTVPLELEYTFDGSFTADIPGEVIEWAKDRGKLPDVPCPLRMSEEPMSGSFSAKVLTLSSTTVAVPGDFIFGPSGFVGTDWESTLGATSPVHTVDMEYEDDNWVMGFDDTLIRGKFEESEDGNNLTFDWACPHPYPTLTAVP